MLKFLTFYRLQLLILQGIVDWDFNTFSVTFKEEINFSMYIRNFS